MTPPTTNDQEIPGDQQGDSSQERETTNWTAAWDRVPKYSGSTAESLPREHPIMPPPYLFKKRFKFQLTNYILKVMD